MLNFIKKLLGFKAEQPDPSTVSSEIESTTENSVLEASEQPRIDDDTFVKKSDKVNLSENVGKCEAEKNNQIQTSAQSNSDGNEAVTNIEELKESAESGTKNFNIADGLESSYDAADAEKVDDSTSEESVAEDQDLIIAQQKLVNLLHAIVYKRELEETRKRELVLEEERISRKELIQRLTCAIYSYAYAKEEKIKAEEEKRLIQEKLNRVEQENKERKALMQKLALVLLRVSKNKEARIRLEETRRQEEQRKNEVIRRALLSRFIGAINALSNQRIELENKHANDSRIIEDQKGGSDNAEIPELGENMQNSGVETSEDLNKQPDTVNPNAIWLDGKPYNSKAEIAKAYGISPATLYNKLRKGWTLEQIVGLEEYIPPKVEFNGKTYDSERAMADAFGVAFTTYKSRLAFGWSQEEALGLVVRVPEDPELAGKTYLIEQLLPGIRQIFEENIYCILGIPSTALKRQVLDSKDRLEKYNKLGVMDAYKTDFELPFVQKPGRELGHIQVVLSSFGSLSDRWLWFETPKFIPYWNRKIIDKLKANNAEYDELLACYFQVLIADPNFTFRTKWNKVLSVIDNWRELDDEILYSRIANHISEDDRKKYNKRMVVSSFKDFILDPLMTNIKHAEGEYLLAAIPYWKSSSVSFARNMLDECIQGVLSYANSAVEPIISEVNCVPNHSNPSTDETKAVMNVSDRFLSADFKLIVALTKVIEGEDVYSEAIQEKIRKNLWDAGFIVWKGDEDEAAARIFANIYMFCNKENKQQIKNTFSLELLTDIPESEFTTDEKKKIADKFDEKEEYDAALKWYRTAANAGNADAHYKIATYYENGFSVTKNETEAYEWYKKAADKGNLDSIKKLASEYFRGSAHCRKDPKKAKEYWIKIFIENPYSFNERRLDKYFPGWKKENNEVFNDLKYKRKSQLESIADRGVPAAAYWLGENLYGNTLFFGLGGLWGYETDKNAARRWFLRAAVYDYAPAVTNLRRYYGIDANEVYSAQAMLNLGAKYRQSDDLQEQDLAFYWLCKAKENGHDDVDNLIGLCYDNGIGVEQNYEKGNECFLRSIENKNNSGALYNYALNLYYGHGVDEDEDAAKEYFLKAKAAGNKAATEFLSEYYDMQVGVFDFDKFEDSVIYNKDGLRIEFCGLQDAGSKLKLKFWVNNRADKQHNIWLKSVNLDGNSIASFKKIGEYEANTGSGFSIIELEGELGNSESNITFSIEIDDDDDNEILTTSTVQLTALMHIELLQFKLLADDSEDSDSDEEDDDEPDYSFANDDFDDIVVYDKNGFRVEFGGFEVEDGDVYIKIWTKNTSGKIIRLWLKDTVVDGNRVEEYTDVATCMPDNSWESHKVLLEEVDLEIYYDVEFTVEVNDENNHVIGLAKRVKVRIDFSEEEIDVTLVDHVDYDDDDEDDDDEDDNEDDEDDEDTGGDYHPASTMDPVYVENSFCMRNPEHNGLEIYFPSIPNEYIRSKMKEQGWRWHRQKGCWYNRENFDSRALAKRITGTDIKG